MLIRKLHGSDLFVGAAACAVCIGLTLPASAAARHGKSANADQQFITEAIQGDLAEVNMGKLAQQKGQSDRVKQYGQMLEQDHSEHLQKAQQIAGQDGLKAPSEPNAMQQSMYQKLNSMPADKFDAAFARDMVRDHEKDIAKYRKEASSGSPLADFAKQTVPVLQKHLQNAEALTSSRAASK
jgi:putative membrane protein